jgi:hypothetical protein
MYSLQSSARGTRQSGLSGNPWWLSIVWMLVTLPKQQINHCLTQQTMTDSYPVERCTALIPLAPRVMISRIGIVHQYHLDLGIRSSVHDILVGP